HRRDPAHSDWIEMQNRQAAHWGEGAELLLRVHQVRPEFVSARRADTGKEAIFLPGHHRRELATHAGLSGQSAWTRMRTGDGDTHAASTGDAEKARQLGMELCHCQPIVFCQ